MILSLLIGIKLYLSYFQFPIYFYKVSVFHEFFPVLITRTGLMIVSLREMLARKEEHINYQDIHGNY